MINYRHHLLRSLIVLVLLAAWAPPGWAQRAGGAEAGAATTNAGELKQKTTRLTQQIETILGASDVTGGKVGIYAVDANSGAVLYQQGIDIVMNPASNTKLVTAAAILDKFGPSHTFRTELWAPEKSANRDRFPDGKLQGPLYLRSDGDPFLLLSDFLELAHQLQSLGVTQVVGDLVVDESRFAGEHLPPAFEQKAEDAAYRAAVGAVSVNFNAISVKVLPGATPGEPPVYLLQPPNDAIEVVNRARTVEGARRAIELKSETLPNQRTRLTLTGTIGVDARAFQTPRKRIDNPPQFAGSAFQEALKSLGIDLTGKVVVGPTPASARALLSHESRPISYSVNGMNKWSNNFIAEMLLRAMSGGADEASTWAASQAAVMAFMQQTGIDLKGFVYKNGSGLYDANRMSARQVVELLRYMHTHRWGPEFKASLAISGVDGTMLRRLDSPATRGKLRAKTGSLNEVTALSGYARTDSGREVIFSIIFNDPPALAWRYRPVQDRLAEAIQAFDR